jgi:heptosyltransferase-2
MTDKFINVNIPARPWTKKKWPKRILAIRLQAMGDLVAALPYLQELRDSLPSSVCLDLLTREEVEDIPRNILLFNKIFSIGGARNFKKQLISTFLLLPKLFIQRYDVIIDLQNNIISKIVRKTLLPKAWSVFDRFSPIAGGERYRLTIEAVGIGKNKAANKFRLKYPRSGETILKESGWQQQNELVVLNPAAAFETRSWNIHNYVAFAKLWLNKFPRTQFLVIGTSFIASKADFLKEQLGEKLINLIGKTTPSQAFAILQQVKLVLSEDSGLMHMAWGSGIPTMGLFGATRTDWVRPLGEHTFFLDSSDLPCGGCMQETCKFGDVHCLTRYTAEQVFYHAFSLIQKIAKHAEKIIIE